MQNESLKRHNRDKDGTIETLSTRVSVLSDQLDEVRRNQTKLSDDVSEVCEEMQYLTNAVEEGFQKIADMMAQHK